MYRELPKRRRGIRRYVALFLISSLYTHSPIKGLHGIGGKSAGRAGVEKSTGWGANLLTEK
jgi:hypothetical protein